MSFRINPERSAELLSLINRGVIDRDIIATPGDLIRPGTGGPQQLGQRVQPGDLITADFINLILARLEALENKPAPTVPTVTVPTFPTLTFPTIFTLPTLGTPTFSTISTFFPTFGTFATIPTNIATFQPSGLATGLATGLGGLGNFGLGGIGGLLRREASTTELPGIGREEETRLTAAGINNLGAVAEADPVVLGNTLRMDPTSAARVIGIARGALGPR